MSGKIGNLKRLVASEWPKWEHVPFYEIKIPWPVFEELEHRMGIADFLLFEGDGAYYIKRAEGDCRIYGFTDLHTATVFKLRFG